MESIFTFICEHAHYAPWILFGLLLLGGLNLPTSEDILIIGGGALCSTCIPNHTFLMYILLLLGCYLSAWEGYWIGRLLWPKVNHFRLFNHVLPPSRIEKIRYYFAKWGIFTFIIGRFCPGGVRNALFLTSGLTKMPFYVFVLRDGVAAFISCSVLFFIGFKFGQNLDLVLHYFERYTEWFFAFLILIILCYIGYVWAINKETK